MNGTVTAATYHGSASPEGTGGIETIHISTLPFSIVHCEEDGDGYPRGDGLISSPCGLKGPVARSVGGKSSESISGLAARAARLNVHHHPSGVYRDNQIDGNILGHQSPYSTRYHRPF